MSDRSCSCTTIDYEYEREEKADVCVAAQLAQAPRRRQGSFFMKKPKPFHTNYLPEYHPLQLPIELMTDPLTYLNIFCSLVTVRHVVFTKRR